MTMIPVFTSYDPTIEIPLAKLILDREDIAYFISNEHIYRTSFKK